MFLMWRQRPLLGPLQQALDMQKMRTSNDIDGRDSDAWEQVATDVLVYGDAPVDDDQEDVFRSRTATPTWTQAVPTDLGDAAQIEKRDGEA